ncbi:MAG: division/cell wall cluster transcriptional repressor MraZ [Chloroflexi bacterium]|nr:division/cell wall cluster transcriptional repressor MraZ [Chloroflexota bacterium]
MTPGFLGTHEYRVDAKGRIPLPPAFRERLLAEGGVLSPGRENCIVIYATGEWDRRTEQLNAKPDDLFEVREDLRARNAFSYPLEIDKQNRITLPPSLRQHAGIQDEAIVTGCGKYVEIWNRAGWQAEKESLIKRV